MLRRGNGRRIRLLAPDAPPLVNRYVENVPPRRTCGMDLPFVRYRRRKRHGVCTAAFLQEVFPDWRAGSVSDRSKAHSGTKFTPVADAPGSPTRECLDVGRCL